VRLSKAGIAGLTLPASKTDHIEWDDTLPGFGLRLRSGGKATWIVQYRVGPKQRRSTIGDLRKLDPDAARREAKRRLGAVAIGRDPRGEQLAALAASRITLGSIADAYLEFKRTKLRSSSLTAASLYLKSRFKPLRELPVNQVSRRDVAAQLNEIARTYGPTAARNARSTLSAAFSWAMREGYVDANPVIGTNKPGGSNSRDRVLDGGELAAVWRACEGAGEYGTIVRLLMLTAARREEIAGLRWSEIDLDRGTFRISGERTKNHRELVLLLPPVAMSIVEAIPRREGRELLFGEGAGPFSGWSAAKRLLDARIAATGAPLAPWVLHDIRRSVATHMAETLAIQPHVIEALLNHVSGHKAGVAGVYNRATYQNEIRAALALWADHVRWIVEGAAPRVVLLRPAG